MTDERVKRLEKALDEIRERDLDPDSPGGAVALEFLLDASATPSSPARPANPSGAPAPTQERGGGQAGGPDQYSDAISAIAEWSGADASRIGDFFDVSDEGVLLTVPTPRLPRQTSEKQRILTLLALAVDRIGLAAENTPAARINAMADDYAVLDQNLPQNVAGSSNLVVRKGRRGAYSYRITQPGLDRAQGLVSELVSGEEVLAI